MSRQHAVEIVLTRPATGRELHRTRRVVPLAVNANGTGMMTVRSAKSPGRALRSLRRELEQLLPIDVLTTHYPDQCGQVLLNVDLPHALCSALRREAASRGGKPADFFGRALAEALERDEWDRTRQLTVQLEGLLTQHAPDAVLACAAHVASPHGGSGNTLAPHHLEGSHRDGLSLNWQIGWVAHEG